MSSVTAFIRVSTKKTERAIVRFRLRDGRDVQLFCKSEIEVTPALWDTDKQTFKAKVIYNEEEQPAFNNSIAEHKNVILKAYNAGPIKLSLTSECLVTKIDEILNPDKYLPARETPQTFFESFNEFLQKHCLLQMVKRLTLTESMNYSYSSGENRFCHRYSYTESTKVIDEIIV